MDKSKKKPLRTTDEWMNVGGANLLLCIACETDPSVSHGQQAIVIVRGFSLCREHMDSWIFFGIHDIPSKN